MQALLDEDDTQTQQLVETLNVRLIHAMGKMPWRSDRKKMVAKNVPNHILFVSLNWE